MSEANKRIAATFLKALGSGDVATFGSALSDDCFAITAGYSKVSGRRERDMLLRICAAMPQITQGGIEFEIKHVTAEDDRVAVEAQGHATMIGGEKYDNQYHFLLFVRDGKIFKLMEYLDTQLAEQVLGPYLAAAG